MKIPVDYNYEFRITRTTLPQNSGHIFCPETKFYAEKNSYDLYLDDQTPDQLKSNSLLKDGEFLMQTDLREALNTQTSLPESTSGSWEVVGFITPPPEADQIDVVFNALLKYFDQEYPYLFTITQIGIVAQRFYYDRIPLNRDLVA